ncbi:MAG: delta-60 repeat domain-containing protein, partial [Limisphaerales bacterium]
FTNLNGTNINHLARLNADGSLDLSFNPNVSGTVYSLALQTDGQVIVGGNFYSVSGQSRNYLARVKPNGTLDLTFNPNLNPVTDGAVYSTGLQTNGALMISGIFSQVGDQFRTNIARLQPLGPVSSTLSYDGTNLIWLRNGAAPEVWRTKFERSSDGVTWTSLGSGQRINGGWQLTNLTLPAGGRIRARGFTTGGKYNGSSWLVEESAVVTASTPPMIVSNDSNFGIKTNTFAFSVRAVAAQTIITETSVDFVTWLPLQTNVVNNSGQFLFSDALPDVGQRFYRVRQTQP